MAISTHVIGFIPPGEKWKQLKEVWDVCKKANVGIPEEVGNFFDWNEPDKNGVEIEIPYSEWFKANGNEIEIKVSDIHKDIKIIRFYNRW